MCYTYTQGLDESCYFAKLTRKKCNQQTQRQFELCVTRSNKASFVGVSNCNGLVTFTPSVQCPTVTPTIYTWDFGDGTTATSNSSVSNGIITHQYINDGITERTVSVTANGGTALSRLVNIRQTIVIADFGIEQTDPCEPIVTFTDRSTGGVEFWEWDFGDGTYLNSNGHLGTDPIALADNNGGLTSGSYANPIHDYSDFVLEELGQGDKNDKPDNERYNNKY